MLRTLAQLLPFVAGGAFLPSWTSRVIILLGTERPLGAASAYVAGNAIWRLCLGLAVTSAASVTALEARRSGLAIPVGAAWAAALLLAATGAWVLMRPPGSESALVTNLPKWTSTLRRVPPWAAFGYGVYNCVMPGTQWAYFLGGCGVIASADLGLGQRIILLILFIALLEIMLVAPIVIYARNRDEAAAGLARFDRWLSRHAAAALGGALLVMALVFAFIGLAGGRLGGTR